MYYTDEARSYGKKLSEDFTSFKKSLQVEITPEIRAEYLKKHLNKKQFFEIDKALMEKIVLFYDESEILITAAFLSSIFSCVTAIIILSVICIRFCSIFL